MQVGFEVGALKKLRRMALPYQRTFHTPLHSLKSTRLESLESFSGTIVNALGQAISGRVIVDEVVFAPTSLQDLLSAYRLSPDVRRDSWIIADGPAEMRQLLSASLDDWVNFLFIPTPRPFMLYADHDEYTTFFAATRSNLNRVTARLADEGFDCIDGYVRKF